MTEKQPDEKESPGGLAFVLAGLAAFLWPAVYLWRDIVPVGGRFNAIGNDFIALYYKSKLYLLDCLSDGRFPWWSPAEACGFPFHTNPFNAAFYPLNWPLVAWYRAAGGYSALDHQRFAVLALCIFALGLFLWLRRIGIALWPALLAALVMSVSFKATELVRFPNAAHAAAWHPWILYALTGAVLAPSARVAARHAALLASGGVLLCTAGYPYFLYYGLFLFGPYLACLLVGPLRRRLFGVEEVAPARVAAALLVPAVVVGLLCGPYILQMRRMLSWTLNRSGNDYAFSIDGVFSPVDTLGSLVYPPAASIEGWYFFSVTALLVVVVSLFAGRAVAPRRAAPLAILAWMLCVSLVTWHTWIFDILWRHLPGFSSLRMWGRLNIILVPLLAWLLALACAGLSRALFTPERPAGRRAPAYRVFLALAVVFGVVLIAQLTLHVAGVRDPYWPDKFRAMTAEEGRFIARGIVAFAVLVLLVLAAALLRRGRRWLGAVAFVAILSLATWEMWPVGAHTWTEDAAYEPFRPRLDVKRLNQASFQFPRADCGTISLWPNFSIGIVDCWYYKAYVDFFHANRDNARPLQVFLGMADGRRLFLSQALDHPTLDAFLADAMRYRIDGRIVSFDGDELDLEVVAPGDLYLSYIDNWDEDWRVEVEGRPARMELLFGTFKAVRLTAGVRRVRFRYDPPLRRLLGGAN